MLKMDLFVALSQLQWKRWQELTLASAKAKQDLACFWIAAPPLKHNPVAVLQKRVGKAGKIGGR